MLSVLTVSYDSHTDRRLLCELETLILRGLMLRRVKEKGESGWEGQGKWKEKRDRQEPVTAGKSYTRNRPSLPSPRSPQE